MVTTKHRILGVLLSALLVVTSCCFAFVSASAEEITDKDLTETAAAGDSVYCQNDKGWDKVYCYMWDTKNGNANNKSWPGVLMTDMGDGLWSYEVPGTHNMIIFNNGSGTQTGDMTFPGNNALYNNSTGEWDTYDPSPLVVSSLKTDVASPQYNDTEITISATGKSLTNATIYYRFSVSGAANAVLSDYSTASTCKWTPTAAGSYTITVDVKDELGNTNTRSISYEIKDDSTEVKPIIKKASPSSGSYVKTGQPITMAVTAGGGCTGTKLLFYKFIVKDPSGNQINTAYYTLNNKYTFTASKAGTYTVDVSVQSSDNSTAKKTFTYEATGADIPTTTAPATAPATTAPVTTAPVTTAPVTTAPVTTAPVTTVPVTTAPVTTVPVTTAPVTTAPVTTVPVTTVPVTTVPVTTVPVTTAPLTTIPFTTVPVTTAPLTTIPTTVPVTTVPTTTVPVTTAPITTDPADTDTLTVNGEVFSVGDKITYVYKLKTDERLENVAGNVTFDGAKIKLLESSDNADDAHSVLPVLMDEGGVAWNTGFDSNSVYFNATSLTEGYDFTNEGILVKLTFEVVGTGKTTVSTNIDDMTGKTKPYIVFGKVENKFSSTEIVEKKMALKGDVNGDGRLSIGDATLIQKWIAKLIGNNDIDLTVADVDNDNRVSIKDATQIQKKLAGYAVNW